MSWLALDWAETAPVAGPFEWIILNQMAARADIDGEGCYLSPATIARRANMPDDQTIKRNLKTLLKRGLIALGDQSRAAHIPANRRPMVYDLLIPASAFSARQWEEVQRFRAEHGRPPLSAQARPDIPEPPPTRKTRADQGVARPRTPEQCVQGMTTDDPEPVERGLTSENSQGYLADPPGDSAGVSTRPPRGDLRDTPGGVYETPKSLRSNPPEESSGEDIGADHLSAASPTIAPPQNRFSKRELHDPATWRCDKHLAVLALDPAADIPSCGPCARMADSAKARLAADEQAAAKRAGLCSWHDPGRWRLDPETGLAAIPAVKCDCTTPPDEFARELAELRAQHGPPPVRESAVGRAEYRRRFPARQYPTAPARGGRRRGAVVPASKDGQEAAPLASGLVDDAVAASKEAENVSV